MITLKKAFEKKYPKYSEMMASRFKAATGVEFSWENITKPNLVDITSFLQNNLAKSTARTHCAMLKATLSIYENEVELPRGWRDVLSVKKDASQQVYLSDEEIMCIASYTTYNQYEDIVKTFFLLGCLTGARHSDFLKFTKNNARNGFIQYVSIKTHTEATVPIAPMVMQLIEKVQTFAEVEMADSTFNDVLRRICKDVGIDEQITLYRRGKFTTDAKYKFVSSHTARRSFATNLYLRGADLYSISKMMGHSSVDMTSGYICCGLRNLPDNVTSYFEQFK